MRYKIRIPEPCNEKWSEMTPTEKGAFCSNCKKEVMDYTNTSTYQLAKLLDREEELCGKFRPDQLNVEFSSVKNRKYPKASLLLGLSTFLSIATPIFGQNKTAEVLYIEQSKKVEKDSIDTKKQVKSILIEGMVADDDYPLPGANILFKDSYIGTTADFDGNFSLTIDRKEINENLTLVVSYIGYETQEVTINEKTRFIKVSMVEDQCLLGDTVVLGGIFLSKKQTIFRRIGNLFRRNR